MRRTSCTFFEWNVVIVRACDSAQLYYILCTSGFQKRVGGTWRYFRKPARDDLKLEASLTMTRRVCDEEQHNRKCWNSSAENARKHATDVRKCSGRFRLSEAGTLKLPDRWIISGTMNIIAVRISKRQTIAFCPVSSRFFHFRGLCWAGLMRFRVNQLIPQRAMIYEPGRLKIGSNERAGVPSVCRSFEILSRRNDARPRSLKLSFSRGWKFRRTKTIEATRFVETLKFMLLFLFFSFFLFFFVRDASRQEEEEENDEAIITTTSKFDKILITTGKSVRAERKGETLNFFFFFFFWKFNASKVILDRRGKSKAKKFLFQRRVFAGV